MIKSVNLYVKAVTSGKQVACQFVKQSVKRHVADLKTANKRGLNFDEQAAKTALAFFSLLHHSKGEWANKPFVLEPWQAFCIAMIFGWKRADGTRRFRRAYIEVARKNGKSTLMSGIGLYLLVADDEPGAEVYTAATKRDQARIIHSEAIRMVKSSPALREEIGVFKDNLHVIATNSKFEPLGADDDTTDGLNIHGGLIDELHAHKTRGMVDVLDTATGARRQPLIAEITTAGWNRQTICWEHHEYSRQVLEATIEDDSWFAIIYSLDKDDDWKDPKVWPKANPNYGVSVKIDDMKTKAERARKTPAEQNTFKRLKLNIWTEQSERWMDMDEWDACTGDLAFDDPFYLKRLLGRKCYPGLDLANTTDIAALVLVFPADVEPPEASEDESGDIIDFEEVAPGEWSALAAMKWPDKKPDEWPREMIQVFDVLPFFFVPEATVIARSEKSGVRYDVWVDQGLIVATEGNVIDYGAITVKFSEELAKMFDIQEVAYDRWGATQLIQDLQDGGLEVIPFGQGYKSMSPPTKELMNVTLGRRLRHGGHPVLRWMAGNMVVTQDPAGNLKPDKSKSSEKIDGMVALIMGLDRATRHDSSKSKYETEDIETW